MDKKLENKIYKKFPHLYRERFLDPSQTCMVFGLAVNDGWFKIVYDLSKLIDNYLKTKEKSFVDLFAVVQVKEKFGGLRYYVEGSDAHIDKLIADAEEKSLKTCEICGNPGIIRNIGWIKVCCNSCRYIKKGI